jgi:hypothetical protein
MTFYDFVIMNDQPADPKVNVVTQLDNNWDRFDDRLSLVQLTTDINTLPATMKEAGVFIAGKQGGNNKLFYSDGASWIPSDDYNQFWSAWTTVNINIDAGQNHYPNAPVKWRQNSKLRCVELSGGIIRTGGYNTFYITLSNSVSGSDIPNTFRPVGANNGKAFCQVASFPQVDGNPASQYSTGTVQVIGNGVAGEVEIKIKWVGQDTPPAPPPSSEGRGFFLDRVRWWY